MMAMQSVHTITTMKQQEHRTSAAMMEERGVSCAVSVEIVEIWNSAATAVTAVEMAATLVHVRSVVKLYTCCHAHK